MYPEKTGVEFMYWNTSFLGPHLAALVGNEAGTGALPSVSHQHSQTPGKKGPWYSPYWRLTHSTVNVDVARTAKTAKAIK